MALYAVPQAIVYRSWAAGAAASGGTTTRRLLLRNSDPSQSISFRLTLPSSAALRVSGACVKRATFDNISSVDLPPGGTEVLVVELLHDAAASDGRAEIIDELLLRTHEAMAMQLRPVIATTAPPLYAMMFCARGRRRGKRCGGGGAVP